MNNWKQISLKARAWLLSNDEFYRLDCKELDWFYNESSKKISKTVSINKRGEYTISFNDEIISIAQNANIIIGLICDEKMHKATIEIQKPTKENKKFNLRMDKNFNALDNSDIKFTIKKIEDIVLNFNELIQKTRQEKRIKSIATKRTEGFGSEKAFMQWYMDQNKKCCYCGITEKQLGLLGKKELLKTKRIKNRGHSLEIDRKLPNLEYSDQNCCMACYWCNNAKTDEFSPEEFKEIARGINKVWNERLSKAKDVLNLKENLEEFEIEFSKEKGNWKVEFHEESEIWNINFDTPMQ